MSEVIGLPESLVKSEGWKSPSGSRAGYKLGIGRIVYNTDLLWSQGLGLNSFSKQKHKATVGSVFLKHVSVGARDFIERGEDLSALPVQVDV